MRIHQLFHDLTTKYVPMDETSKSELHLDSINFYNALVEERKAIIKDNQLAIDYNNLHQNDTDFVPRAVRPLLLKHKIVSFLELWFMRYIFALLFIYFVPKIQRYINGETDDDFETEDDFQDDDEKQYQDFLNFKRGMR